MRKAVFLDRDGVINRKAPEGEYVTRWEEMIFLPGVAEAIAALRRVGFLVVVVSNQRCVAKGLLSVSELESLHGRMRAKLNAEGGVIDAIYFCPHDSAPPCGCRKPAPGLLLRAAAEHEIDLRASWMIGDSASDMEAGRAAKCKTAYVRAAGELTAGADLVAASLSEAAAQILEHETQLVAALQSRNRS